MMLNTIDWTPPVPGRDGKIECIRHNCNRRFRPKYRGHIICSVKCAGL